MNTKDKGDISEAMVLARLLQLGKKVAIPFGENHRYDLLIDDGGVFTRVRCKTARIRKGCVVFNARSTNARISMNYRGEADLFIAYCPQIEKFYQVDVALAAAAFVTLRLEPTKNNQEAGVKYARDHEL